MSKYSQGGFVHSVKVPRIYKTASVIVKKVVEEGGSLKDLVYSSGHKNIKGVYALVVETIKHSKELDRLLKVSKLLKNETRLQPWLARILLTELLYGKKELKGESKPVQTVLSYKEQFEKLMKNEKSKCKASNITVKKPRYARVNTLVHTPDEIIKIFRQEGWSFIPCPTDYAMFLDVISKLDDYSFTRDFHIKEVLVFSGNVQFYEHELYQNGSILLQDKASCLPAFLLQPKPNSVALDMCAAPGMKTTHLCALMKNKGKVFASEVNPKRFKVLCDVLTNAGCTNVTPLNVDALKLKQDEDENLSWTQDVEYILVDPSCSGTGIIERTQIFLDEENDSRRLKKLCSFQFKLLMHALTNFPKTKRVVYSTCSVQPQENEKVVEDVINKLNSLDEKPKFKLTEPLKETWLHRGSDDYEHGKFCLFSDPKKDLTNGFFIAVFERVEENERESSVNPNETIEDSVKKKRKLCEEKESLEENNVSQKEHKKKKKKKDKVEGCEIVPESVHEVEDKVSKKKKQKKCKD